MLRFSLLVLLSRRAEAPRLFTHTCPHCTKETAAKVQHNVLGEGKEKARGRALAYWMKAFDQDGDGKIPIERLIKTTPPHRLFHRISIYVRTIFCWDHASFMLASRQFFIGSASAPRQLRARFALPPRQLRVGFASKPQNTCCERLRRGASRASGIGSRYPPPMTAEEPGTYASQHEDSVFATPSAR